MEISKATIGVLAAVCIAAGAGGSYLANRSDAPASEAAVVETPDLAADAVEHSDAVVGDTAAPLAEPAPAPAAPVTAPPRTREARSSAPAPMPVAVNRPPAERPAPPVQPVAPPAEREAPIPAPIAFEPPRVTDNQASLVLEPQGPQLEELVIAADSVLGLQVESAVTSERARVEDEVVARVTRDVRVADRVAIPAGSKAVGEVTLVERGGRMRDRARLGVRFTSIVLADGTRVPIETDTIVREGAAPGGESAAKIGGGAIGGAIIGGILGGAKGAAIGGAVGAGAGTGAVMTGGRNAATLASGSPVTVRIQQPVIVTVER